MKNLFKKILAIGLAATMTLGMAVTSFADDTPEEASSNVVWVNGKDIKAKPDKGIQEDVFNKTLSVKLSTLLTDVAAPAAEEGEGEGEDTVQVGLSATLPEKTKYLISVLDDVEGNDVEKAFPSNKAVKSKKASAKFNKSTSSFKVTAGKEAGDVEIWIAEFNSKEKKITAYNKFDVSVKMAPKKFSIQIPAGEEEGAEPIVKKTTVAVGATFDLEVAYPEGVEVSSDTTFTWSVKAPKTETVKIDDEEVENPSITVTSGEKGATATVAINGATVAKKALNYTITCTNVQSGKKASFKVTAVNDIATIEFVGEEIVVPDAATAKASATVKLGEGYKVKTSISDDEYADSLDSTSKVKAYVSSNIEKSTKDEDGVITTAKGFTYTKGEKKDTFKITEKSKEVSAKIAKDGTITVSAKKGTEGGTQAKLILVVTHKDKTIEVYESVITVGTSEAEGGEEETEPTE